MYKDRLAWFARLSKLPAPTEEIAAKGRGSAARSAR
jgi:hypothetical protein